jgi:hypothetical protein
MSASTLYELIGYIGSALVVTSLSMSSIIRLRFVNLAGAIVFGAYGVLIGAVPIVIANIVITGIDLWCLRRELTTREVLAVTELDPDNGFVATFVALHRHDLLTFGDLPDMLERADVRLVMLRDTDMAGILLGADAGQGVLAVLLDDVAPAYRDLSSGASLHGHGARRFVELGYRSLVAEDVDHRHRDHFAAMGFVESAHGSMVLETGGA